MSISLSVLSTSIGIGNRNIKQNEETWKHVKQFVLILIFANFDFKNLKESCYKKSTSTSLIS